ncbi:hypothetical protein Q7P37_006698 [Cladosporium fusiforme]
MPKLLGDVVAAVAAAWRDSGGTDLLRLSAYNNEKVATQARGQLPAFVPVRRGVEFVGYCARVASAGQAPDYRLMAYVIQATYILLAPTLMAASIYMELGRIVRLTDGEPHSIISSSKITKIFVTGDVVCLLAQSAGGGVSAAGHSFGTKIVIGGLVIQLLVFLTFVVVAAFFNIRMNRVPTTKSVDVMISWRRHMRAIYISSGLIFLRSLIRLVEYAEGFSGYLYTHEWCLYCLDCLPMLIVAGLFIFIHPSEINAWLKGGKGFRGFTMSVYESRHYPLQHVEGA